MDWPGQGPRNDRPHFSRSRHATGFTLIELVVVIVILAVLAAIAVPRFVSAAREARLASIRTMVGTVNAAAEHVHMLCVMAPDCNASLPGSSFMLNGHVQSVINGYPNAGDVLGIDQIDTWVIHDGFTARLANIYVTEFLLDSAPDPENCLVLYQEPLYFWNPPDVPYVVTLTSGC